MFILDLLYCAIVFGFSIAFLVATCYDIIMRIREGLKQKESPFPIWFLVFIGILFCPMWEGCNDGKHIHTVQSSTRGGSACCAELSDKP